MRQLVLLVVVALCTGAGAQTQAVSPGEAREKTEKASIEGRVLRAPDGSPLRKATVMAMLSAEQGSRAGRMGPMRPSSATTDGDGKFVLKDLDPGRYMLSVMRSGYVRQTYGEGARGATGTILTLAAGQKLKDVEFRMIQGGVIAGRIVDEDSEPVFQARVEALRWVFFRGKRQLMPAGGTMTNDLGEYRIAQLAPGRYILSSSHPGALMYMRTTNSDVNEGYSQTYFPGVYDSSQAVPVDVKGGEEVGGMNLRLVPMQAVKIRGVVKGGEKALGVNVQLIAKSTAFGRPERMAMADESGVFEITGVMPGSYTIVANSFENEKQMGARQPIDVGDADIDGITLVLKPGTDVVGRVRYEGNAPPKERQIRVMLTPEEPFYFGAGMPAQVGDDMSFTLKAFPDGDYRVVVVGLPENGYLKSATVGGRDVLEDGLHLAGASRPLEIVISTNAGRVEGTVTDGSNNAATNARVVLVPEEPRRKRQDLFRIASTDQYGRFSVRGVPPGTYTLFAWESVEEGAYHDPEFLKMYQDAGKTVRVGESSQTAQDLKVIPGQVEGGN